MALTQRIVYQQGDHVCTLYESPAEQLRAAIEYIQGGLSRGERCLYVCGEHDIADFCRALKTAGVKVQHEQARGALILVTKHDAHLKGGTFDPAAMIDRLKTAVEEALAQGFIGLCQYHRNKLPAAVLDHCMATHRYVRVDGPILLENPFHELPETAIRRIARPDGVDKRMSAFRSKTAH